MNTLNTEWPTEDDLHKSSTDGINLAPYGVVSETAESVYHAYSKKLMGTVTARSREKENGDKTEFVYSLYISTVTKESAQIKLLEFHVQDDGWYPVSVYLLKPQKELIGKAENESQLRKFIGSTINSDFVKVQLRSLLPNTR